MAGPKIEIAEDLTLPANAAVQVYAFMGRRGSGKTFGAGRLVEQVVGAGGQVLILDPVGTWYGLRLAADGKSPGISIPVFGGLHGDIPLEATAGKVVAELAAERATSLVLDVSNFTGADQRRFVADFATEFFQAKKRNRSAVLVVMEEAQEFAPQRVSGDTARMVGAVERMIKLGRNFGIGTALVSQRPQAINKDVLNQSEVMFCFQMTGPQERKTIEGWVQEKGAGGRDIGDQLPSLPVGTALMWSPQWLGLFGRYKILRKATYDASATPGVASAKAATLAPIDLDHVRAAMAATIEEAKAKDPVELRREVARLRSELAKKPAVTTATTTVEVIGEAAMKRIEALADKLTAAESAFAEATAKAADRLAQAQQAVLAELGNLVTVARRAAPPSSSMGAPRWFAPPAAARTVSRPSSHSGGDIGKVDSGGQARMLRALAGTLKDGLSRRELGALSGVKASGGTFGTYLSRLRQAGYVEDGGAGIRITDAGRAAAGPVEQRRGKDLLDFWVPQLGDKPGGMLTVLFESSTPIERDALADTVGLAGNAGTFGTYLSRLISRGLVDKVGRGAYQVSDAFRT